MRERNSAAHTPRRPGPALPRGKPMAASGYTARAAAGDYANHRDGKGRR